ncbi:purine-binding chemotaxis protein CheW [Lachnotalea glycerini]|jgi:purine-binding chemotaxis protein CheW|uniref:Chemotaxis protein CheW n=1 Tax=Lachnotalea glycerini TaxID=1763509 RepID=A0A255I436_9FIRM|nr:chemotaxis protein CheW [Lachnotalea glycerini]PXV93529.1 purine-binding chemotaxis protein CheW [Lachnotalea glycerini]RDY32490.1 chemotaxis protein CheW [Lachnotalea glycerini]
MEESKVEFNSTQYIVVKIGNEQYGIDISYVDNIVRMQKIIRVPKAQHYFKGVINLRGVIVPVMSIRLKMQLEDDKFDNSSRIIILKMDQALIGIIVDEVKEVVTLENSDIEKMAYDSKDEKTSYINGIGKHDGELISLLDINSVITEKELV